jgi:hypothetical protein
MGGSHPCSTGRRLTTIMVGGPNPRTLVVVPATSHHGQQSGASFNIGGKEGCSSSNSLKIEIAR